MPVILILLGSIGWLGNVVIAFQNVNLGNTALVSAHTSNAIGFLWVIFGGLLWQSSRQP